MKIIMTAPKYFAIMTMITLKVLRMFEVPFLNPVYHLHNNYVFLFLLFTKRNIMYLCVKLNMDFQNKMLNPFYGSFFLF